MRPLWGPGLSQRVDPMSAEAAPEEGRERAHRVARVVSERPIVAAKAEMAVVRARQGLRVKMARRGAVVRRERGEVREDSSTVGNG